MVSLDALEWYEANLTGRPSPPLPSPELPADVRIEDTEIAGVPHHWCIPAAADAETVISVDAPWPAAVLYLPDVDMSAGGDPIDWAARLATRSGVRVLVGAAGSTLTPAAAAYDWLLTDGGFLGQHVAVVAEGACGATALALLDRLAKDQRVPDGPALVVLLSPWIDPAVADPSGRDRGSDPAPVEPTDLRLGGDLVHSVAALRHDAATRLPPPPDPGGWRTLAAGAAAVHVGGSEVLIGDALRATRAFAVDDVPVTLRVWPYQQHGFHRPVGRFHEAALVTDDIAATVRSAVRE